MASNEGKTVGLSSSRVCLQQVEISCFVKRVWGQQDIEEKVNLKDVGINPSSWKNLYT